MKKTKSETKREQIVYGLMRAMAKYGYERSSIAAIAKEAKIRSGLVHYYFANKQEILLSLLDLLVQTMEQRYLDKQQQADATPEAKLYAFIDAYVGIGEDASPESVACWVTIGAEALHLEAVRQSYICAIQKSLEQLKLHLMECLVSEGKQTDRIHELAAGIMSAIEGAYQLAILSPDLVPAGFAAPTIKSMAKGLLDAQPFRQNIHCQHDD